MFFSKSEHKSMFFLFLSYGSTKTMLKKMHKKCVLFMKGNCKGSMVFSVSMSIAFPKAGNVVGKM